MCLCVYTHYTYVCIYKHTHIYTYIHELATPAPGTLQSLPSSPCLPAIVIVIL